MAASSSSSSLPRVAVLLATWNGVRWLPEQVRSILDQAGVDVRLIALDDESTDGTREWLLEQAAADPRITVLPSMGKSGGAAPNFYRLLEHADLAPDELVAFADQDDIWRQGKLARHAALIRDEGYDGISSSITSFTADGARHLVRKDFPQRQFDYLFESPGPGSTFLMTPRLVAVAKEVVQHDLGGAHQVDYHDSLVYAIARAHGWKWHIDGEPTVDYRQHDANVMGANTGSRAAIMRLQLIRSRWHRDQAVLLADVAATVADPGLRPAIEGVRGLLTTRGLRSRYQLARLAPQLRRRPRDRKIIGLLIASGVW